MKSILVVDYSRTGNTKRVGEAIASGCGADLEQISDRRPRGGLLGWLRSGSEAWRRQSAEIMPTQKEPRDYSLVVLGSPVWVGTISSPMRRYLAEHASKLDKIALFVTEGGSGGEACMREMAALCGKTPIATLELRRRDLRSEAYRNKVADFVRRIREA